MAAPKQRPQSGATQSSEPATQSNESKEASRSESKEKTPPFGTQLKTALIGATIALIVSAITSFISTIWINVSGYFETTISAIGRPKVDIYIRDNGSKARYNANDYYSFAWCDKGDKLIGGSCKPTDKTSTVSFLHSSMIMVVAPPAPGDLYDLSQARGVGADVVWLCSFTRPSSVSGSFPGTLTSDGIASATCLKTK